MSSLKGIVAENRYEKICPKIYRLTRLSPCVKLVIGENEEENT